MSLTRLLLVTCALFGGSGCYINTQRYPAPMRAPSELPEGLGAVFAQGPEEALVVRHADPVLLRRAGEDSGFPLRFYSKTARVNSGSWIQCGAGGRAEVVFPGDGYLILTGRGTAVLGSPGRGEPVAAFLQVSRAEIQLVGNDYARLLGGALLSGEGGPYVIEKERDDVLALTNRSRGPCHRGFSRVHHGARAGRSGAPAATGSGRRARAIPTRASPSLRPQGQRSRCAVG